MGARRGPRERLSPCAWLVRQSSNSCRHCRIWGETLTLCSLMAMPVRQYICPVRSSYRPGQRVTAAAGLEGWHVIQSVDRAIRVLTALQGSRRMTLSELAIRLELPPSTVHGIVRTLVGHGMVTQERGSSRYQLRPAVLLLGNVYLDTLEL